MKDRLGQDSISKTSANRHKTFSSRRGIRRFVVSYACVQVQLRGRVRNSLVQCTIDEEEKGREGEITREMKK
jgi:hypothetical protein